MKKPKQVNPNTAPPHEFIKYVDELETYVNKLEEQLRLYSVVKSLPDVDNYDYLRGFVDGYGGEEPHDVFPDGFKDINEIWGRMYELKGNEA